MSDNLNGANRDLTMDLETLMQPAAATVETFDSPLEKAIAHPQVSGLIAKSEDIKMGNEPLRNSFDSDERREEFDDALHEMNISTRKANAIQVVVRPENQIQMVQMMGEIEAVTFTEEGKAIIPEGAKYIAEKNIDDGIETTAKLTYTKDNVVPLPQPAPEEKQIAVSMTASPTKSVADRVSEEETRMRAMQIITDDDKSKFVQVLIDKTGLGKDFDFTTEENAAIEHASQIRIVEVENKELQSLRVERDLTGDLSFMETASKYQMSLCKTRIYFPISGFYADMTGLNYSELADIALDTSGESDDSINFNRNWRMLTVVYNHMINPSCGKFKNFDDFLRKFSYFDLPLALYGMLCSTQPDEESIGLTCPEEHCKKVMDVKYLTKSLLDFNTASKDYLAAMDKLNDARGDALYEVAENSPVRTTKNVKLPSEAIAFIGPMNCYDYLYTIMNVMAEIKKIAVEIDENNGEPVDGVSADDIEVRLDMMLLLYIIRGLRIPKVNDAYVEISSPKKILEYMEKYMPIEDYRVLMAIYYKAASDYSIGFSFRNVKCPHCDTVHKSLAVNIQDLVFRIHQLLMNVNVTAETLHLF